MDPYRSTHSRRGRTRRGSIEARDEETGLPSRQAFLTAPARAAKRGSGTRSIIQLAHSLGMHVVAEAGEMDTHIDFQIDHDCDIGQGYLFSRPVRASDFEALLRDAPGRERSRSTGLPI
jgi:predicted signal transduction protein with EAL and GGDEF domain